MQSWRKLCFIAYGDFFASLNDRIIGVCGFCSCRSSTWTNVAAVVKPFYSDDLLVIHIFYTQIIRWPRFFAGIQALLIFVANWLRDGDLLTVWRRRCSKRQRHTSLLLIEGQIWKVKGFRSIHFAFFYFVADAAVRCTKTGSRWEQWNITC